MTDALDSGTPSIDSPTTPVNNHHDLKIDIEFTEESDVRNEPLPVKVSSTFPELGTPVNPDVIAIEPPKGTPPPAIGELLDDVRMAEEETPPMLSPPEEDVKMAEEEKVHEERAVEATVNECAMETDIVKEETKLETDQDVVVDDEPTPKDEHDQDDERPTKRARRSSNADEESIIANATPPPVTASVASPTAVDNNALSPEAATHPPPSNASSASSGAFTQAQFKFCLSALRQVKKSKDAKPFLYPVDHIGMNIPHYPSIITHPMDFSTVERKLNASSPVKPDPTASSPRYHTADEFIADVRLIFSNCVTFNGPDHQITHMGKRVEEMFDKSVKNLPGPEEAKPVVIKKAPVPAAAPPPPPAAAKRGNVRRASNSFPPLRRNEDGPAARPKREIHPPASKDLPYTDAPKKARKARTSKGYLNAQQLEFCSRLLQDLHRKTYWSVASPFYEPVDWVTLELPTYPKVVKKPMDLSTMRKRMDQNEYTNPTKFFEDFKLMIRNCFLFNPPGTPVNQAGIDLQRLFDDKWKSLPQAQSPQNDEYDDPADVDEETDEDRDRIAEMESQIELMNRNINALKSKSNQKKVKKPAKQASSSAYAPTPIASSSKASTKASAKQQASGSSKKNRAGAASAGGRKAAVDDDVLTFEQKKHLSEAITALDGAKLERVIQIIHEGVPEIRDSTEEIELEIDTLPAHVLTKLYNFVIRPQLRTSAPKRSRTGKGTGTGGLKRKSMDEDVEAEKIRQLEARMALFENPDGSAVPSAGAGEAIGNGHDSDKSSDSSDGSDSSGSDSE